MTDLIVFELKSECKVCGSSMPDIQFMKHFLENHKELLTLEEIEIILKEANP